MVASAWTDVKKSKGGSAMPRQYNGDIYNSPAMQAALGIYSPHGFFEESDDDISDGCIPPEALSYFISERKKGENLK